MLGQKYCSICSAPASRRCQHLALAAERLRLLYVGITRARCELILTYNTGRNPERDPNQPALAFTALKDLLDRRPPA